LDRVQRSHCFSGLFRHATDSFGGIGEKMRYFWVALILAVFGGCIPYSDSPLAPPSEDSFDSALCGSWFVRDNDETVLLHFGRDRKSHLLRVVMIESRKDGDLDISEFSGHTSRTGERHYLNLQWVQPTGQPKGYLFVKYVVTEKRLGIALADLEAIETAIDKGALKGEKGRDKDVSFSVRITDTPERLRDYFEKHDKELFGEMQYLERLELSGVPASPPAG
jgi:hypothetical protein